MWPSQCNFEAPVISLQRVLRTRSKILLCLRRAALKSCGGLFGRMARVPVCISITTFSFEPIPKFADTEGSGRTS